MSEHYTREIRESTELSGEIRSHIAGCPECANEVRIMEAIRESLRTMPVVPLPPDVRSKLLELMKRPVLRIWHIIFTVSVLLFAPLLFSRFLPGFNNGMLRDDHFAVLVILTSVLAVALLVPIAGRLLLSREEDVNEFEHMLTDFMQKNIRKRLKF